MATYAEAFEALTRAFATLSSAGEIDVAGDEAGGLDVMADSWTLHAEGWPGPEIAWLACDDESDEYDDQAMDAIRSSPALAALIDADRALDGAIRAALLASGDPLSCALGNALPLAR